MVWLGLEGFLRVQPLSEINTVPALLVTHATSTSITGAITACGGHRALPFDCDF